MVDHVALSRMVERTLRDVGKDVGLIIYPPYADDGHTLFFKVREPWWSDVARFFNPVLGS